MKEAKVTCLIDSYPIKERGLKLTKGQFVWLTLDQFEAAPSVAEGEHIGAFHVVWKERMQTRNAAPPHFRRIVPGHNHGRGALPSPPPQAAPSVSKEDVEAAVSEKLEAFKEDMLGQLASLIAQVKPAEPAPAADNTELLAQMQSMLEKMAPVAVSGAAGAVSRRKRKASASEPVYIPSTIVKDVEARISVQEGEAEGGSIDEAAAALRALRKRKKDGK